MKENLRQARNKAIGMFDEHAISCISTVHSSNLRKLKSELDDLDKNNRKENSDVRDERKVAAKKRAEADSRADAEARAAAGQSRCSIQ